MSRASRGGLTLKSGKIGRVNCLRQQMTMPGERININLSGKVRLETLRERDVFRINAHLGIFWTPLRWLWSGFPDYLKDGPNATNTSPTFFDKNWSKYGIGCYGSDTTSSLMDQHWKDNVLRIFNEWFKHPENSDITGWPDDGPAAVPLSKIWSRCRYNKDPGEVGDYQVNSTTAFDVRDLAATQARFRSAMKRDVMTYNRWMELINDTYRGADASREVDQVPLMIDQVDVGVNPRDMPASDGAGLGQWQSMYDFGVNHSVRGFTAPEHGILCYMLTVRFGSIIEGRNPLGYQSYDWHVMTADPEYLSAAEPTPVNTSDVAMTDTSTLLGYAGAGWEWRCDHDVIGSRIDEMDSFPYMRIPTTQAEAKDATRIKNAFRSQRLGDYVADIYIKEDCIQPIGTAMDSYFAGMLDHTKGQGQSNDEFPKQGKML